MPTQEERVNAIEQREQYDRNIGLWIEKQEKSIETLQETVMDLQEENAKLREEIEEMKQSR
jgi:peptidoglycan hydrolase CwlO-like protein